MDTINTIGYFLLYPLTGSQRDYIVGYIGAILVVNNEGIPLEFKCTEAIKPTPVQRSLYGGTLETHIAVELCAKPLLDKVTNKPAILFVNEQAFLTVHEKTGIPAWLVQQDGSLSDEWVRESCRFELVEPFERIKNAIMILGTQDAKFR